jgi:hypothetical protein
MNKETSIIVQHKNCLSTYLSDWITMMRHVFININPELAQRYNLKKLPTTFESLQNNTYDLSVALAHLDSRLRVLEEKSIPQLDLQAYAEARVFLKAFYVFFRILLDDVSGVIEFFYKKNEPGIRVGRGFHDLLKNYERGDLPEDLSRLLKQPSLWFPEVMDSRDDLVHHYDSHLISIKQGEGGKTILGHFNIKGRAHREYVNIREHFGFLLCEYQTLIDNLLDHFDIKFRDWYGIIQGKSGRNLTIMQGCVAFPLWWAYRYGNYRLEDLQVSGSV